MSKNQDNIHLKFFGIPIILPYLKKYTRDFIVMVVLGLAGTACDVIIPLFRQYAINNYVVTGILDTLPIFIGSYLLVLAMQVIVNGISLYLASRLELYINRDLRNNCFSHLQTLAISYFNQNSVGYIHSRVMSDTSRIGVLVSWNFMDCVWNISYAIGVIIAMLLISPKLALAVLAVVPLSALIIFLCLGKLTDLNRKMREINSKISGDFNEGITGAGTSKSLVIEKKITAEFREDTRNMKRTSVHTAMCRGILFSTISFFSFTALAIILWRGGLITLEGAMKVGTLSVFISYAEGIVETIRWIIDALSAFVSTQVNIERVNKLLTTKSDVTDSAEVIEKYGDAFTPKRENWEDIHGDIEFDDVTFKYPDGEEYVLEHFNLKVPKGTRVAIVGETGAGKSTLVNLVCRFFEPTEGRVLIDGRDARERSQLWLHSSIGYVLQSPHLFSGTVRENLKYGNPEATDEQINSALELVSADKVVARMENGLDSQVGEGGDLLSTGEKQLISFVRAIIADPKILVLDEATSSVDTITEQIINRASKVVTQGRTSFIIAHRLSTVRDADVILVVKDGKIVEQGKHGALMRAKGAYYQLYTHQFERESVDGAFGANE